MHRSLLNAASLALFCAAAGAQATNVSVSIAGEVAPGVYGRVDIGNTPPPVVYTQPVIITRPARPVAAQPVYLHVPPGHAKKWDKHCHKYNACSQPVYFVKSAEYDEPGHKGGKGKHHKHH
ncbi:MAG TPA: hypothetical protein VEC35_08365 [Noviherbaspirillum sp.]|nr:hypothetical protein [Noviherbaspirillum sp.]